MSEDLIWLLLFLLAYLAFCIYVGVRTSRSGHEPRSFFSPTGGLTTWVFVIAVTAATFAGWNFTGHPAQVFSDGFQYANATFFVITVPLAGVLVMKRQWLVGRRFGFVTPGEMYSAYFGSETISIISAGIAVVFGIPFLAMLFSAAGALLSGVADGAISRDVGMWGLASVVLIYCLTGGLTAAAQVGVVQGVLFIGGTVVLGLLALQYHGGLSSFSEGMGAIAAAPATTAGFTQGYGGGDYNGLFAIPGVIQWVAGIGVEPPLGGAWTAVMSLSFALTLMGLQFAPGFSVWGYSSRTPRAFALGQIWGAAFCVGLALFIFSVLQGMSAHLLGANASANSANAAAANVLPELSRAHSGDLVMYLIRYTAAEQPWLMGLLAVCGIAALQSTSAALLSTSGNILSRDIYKRHVNREADWDRQKAMSCVFMFLLCLAALMMASFSIKAALVLASLAIPFSFQLLPSLIAVLWWPWITPRAATAGLITGLLVVVLTEPLGQVLTGNTLPWGRWPWTIYSGMWGMFFNLGICLITASFSGLDPDRARRDRFHETFKPAAISASPRMRSASIIILLVWIFFAVGPGSVLGNSLFGSPSEGLQGWVFGMPSVWAWQILWWALGVGLVWFLAEKMELSTFPDRELKSLASAETIGASDGR